MFKRPDAPTKQELEEHLPTHLPYRSWCPHCVAGRGISRRHATVGGDKEKLGVTISIDYCFFNPEDVEQDTTPILILYDDNLETIWAIPVETKGAVQFVVNWCVEILDVAGYSNTDITIKSDQEPAILALKSAIAANRTGVTAMIDSPVRESKANGAVEGAVRIWQGQFRTLRHYFEKCLGKPFLTDNVLFGWLIVWTSEILLKYRIRKDGRTPYEAMTKHRCNHQAIAFGEKVQFKLATDKNNRHKASSEWMNGVMVGIITRSTEFIIMNENGLYKCTRVQKAPNDIAYDSNCTEYAKFTYEQYVNAGAKTSGVRVRLANPDEQLVPAAGLPTSGGGFVPRRARLAKPDFMEHGYTIGCPGCAWIQAPMGQSKNHTEQCRSRLEEKLGETEDGQERLRRQKDRADHWVAGQIEEPDLIEAPTKGQDISTQPEPTRYQHDAEMDPGQPSGQASSPAKTSM